MACGGSESTGPSTGDMEVTASTSGADLDADGYTVAVDGGAGQPLARNGTLNFSALSAGNHTVTLSGVASNCTVSGENPATVPVSSGQTAHVVFQIGCAQLPIASITVAPERAGVTVGGTVQLTPTCRDQFANELPCPLLAWAANDPTVATVSESGLVTGVGPGSVSVAFAAAGPLGGNVIVYVERPGSVTLTVAPQAWTLLVGGSVQLQPTIRDAGGNSLLGRTPLWTSSAPSVVTVTADLTAPPSDAPSRAALVRAVAPGSVTITATYGDASGSAALTVEVGGSIQVTATTTGADLDPDGYTVAVDGDLGQRLDVNGTVTFSHLSAGDHTVTLSGVAPNCTVSGQNPALVNVTAGVTAQTAFQIACAAIVGTIAFDSHRDGNYEIYVMNAAGSGVTRLTNSPEDDEDPAWSPDATKIAFDSHSEIYVMDADGSGLTRLTNNPAADFSPAWSPDGTKIAFVSSRDGNYEIYVMNADGSDVTRVTDNPADDLGPAWSPDGTKIAFGSTRDGNLEIYVMNANGSGRTRLTNNPAGDISPAWSPDGTKISFWSTRDGNDEIYVMNADGSGVTRLTDNPAADAYAAWSPDGTKIAFESDRAGNFELYVMNADGSGVTRLTNDPADDLHPAWRPER